MPRNLHDGPIQGLKASVKITFNQKVDLIIRVARASQQGVTKP